jgi:hypothetical protein
MVVFVRGLLLGISLLATNLQAQSPNSGLLDLGVLEHVADLYQKDSAPHEATRQEWIHVLETSQFLLPFRGESPKGTNENSTNPLINREMPGSKPRWETGRSDRVRPFSYDEVEDRARMPETDYFRKVETETFHRSTRATQLLSNQDFINWTEVWIAHRVQALTVKRADVRKLCEDIDRGLGALGLLTGGRASNRTESILLLYGLSLGELGVHSCSNLPRITWNLPALKHPRTGHKEIDRQGRLTDGSVASFANILGGTYIEKYDWIVTYDTAVLSASLSDERHVVFANQVLEIQGPQFKKKKMTFSQAVKNLATQQKAFEKRIAKSK